MKFRKEPSIIQRQNKSGQWSFLVRVRTENGEICKTFSEKEYTSAKIAFETAVNYRNQMLYEMSVGLAVKRNNSTVKRSTSNTPRTEN